MDYNLLLNKMIKKQLQTRGVNDKNVIAAMKNVLRHEFVREKDIEEAYDDNPLPIGNSQTISQPYIVAYMTQELETDSQKRVLEIGTGSGYQAAVLAYLSKEVYSIERIEEFYEKAGRLFEKLNIGNIRLKLGDGTEGWKEHAPYDRIILTGAIPKVPEEIEEQVNKDDGIIVAPVGTSLMQKMVKIRYNNGKRNAEEKIGCVFVSLYGKNGFRE